MAIVQDIRIIGENTAFCLKKFRGDFVGKSAFSSLPPLFCFSTLS